MKEKLLDISKKILTTLDSNISLSRDISEWRNILTKECQVYVVGEEYIAKRFDQVYYKYVAVDTAKEILTDNLYAILLYKYFTELNEDVLNQITKIVKSLTTNIKSFLTKINLDDDCISGDGLRMKRVPNTAVAFTNGIFDFQKNDWILKYDKIFIENINNTIILYNDYIIQWCFTFDFEPLPININDTSFEEFCEILKGLDKTNKNYCWELFYNMSHGIEHKSSLKRMQHLSEIFGYTLIPQFLQYFVMLIGSGQNGKNSLFDGCFSSKVMPRPVNNSIEAIEQDRFITDSLANACHNIFLETTAKTYSDSNMLKALTGSMYQTIERKGISKYTSVINCKYIFAGNDQSKIKFSDTTPGFRRRINVFEIYYSWDAEHRFMKYGDYYLTDFSGDLHEIKNDLMNTIFYIYLGMYGIKFATKNFTTDFKFTYNEWTDAYSDIDMSMKDFFNISFTITDLFKYLQDMRSLDNEHLKTAFFDIDKTRLYLSDYMKDLHVYTFEEMVKYLNSQSIITVTNELGEETEISIDNAELFLKDHDVYVSLIYLRSILIRKTSFNKPQRDFNDMFKKIYPYATIIQLSHRESYVKVRYIGGRILFNDK